MTAGLAPSRSSVSPAVSIGSNFSAANFGVAAKAGSPTPFVTRTLLRILLPAQTVFDAISGLVETRIGVRRLAFGL